MWTLGEALCQHNSQQHTIQIADILSLGASVITMKSCFPFVKRLEVTSAPAEMGSDGFIFKTNCHRKRNSCSVWSLIKIKKMSSQFIEKYFSSQLCCFGLFMGESISPFPPKNHLQLFQANVMSWLYGLLMRLSITFDFQSLLPSNFCSWKS